MLSEGLAWTRPPTISAHRYVQEPGIWQNGMDHKYHCFIGSCAMDIATHSIPTIPILGVLSFMKLLVSDAHIIM